MYFKNFLKQNLSNLIDGINYLMDECFNYGVIPGDKKVKKEKTTVNHKGGCLEMLIGMMMEYVVEEIDELDQEIYEQVIFKGGG